jgi:colicin import membrane protein
MNRLWQQSMLAALFLHAVLLATCLINISQDDVVELSQSDRLTEVSMLTMHQANKNLGKKHRPAKRLAKATPLPAQKKTKAQKFSKALKKLPQKQYTFNPNAQQDSEIQKASKAIIDAIREQWRIPFDLKNDLHCRYRLHLAPDGSLLDLMLVQSSGDQTFDESGKKAIEDASPLPLPENPAIFQRFRQFELTLKPG